MKYEELQQRPAYITTNIQMDLYEKVNQYLIDNNLSRTDFANQLGVSKGYVSQILNGDFNHRLSKFVELSTQVGYIPRIIFEPADKDASNKSVSDLIYKLSRSIGCNAVLWKQNFKDTQPLTMQDDIFDPAYNTVA